MFSPSHIMNCRSLLRIAACAAMTAGAAACTADALAAPAWHTDLAAARTASFASQRPVMALFTARWSGSTPPLESPVVSSAEAEALVAACFEPVCLDVDEHAELARKLGVTHVPMVCVVAADDTLVTSFELPSSAAEFVVAVARAAQQAAVSAAPIETANHDPRGGLRIRVSPASPTGEPANAFADQRSPVTKGRSAAGPGSIALVTAKVRGLSDFANDQACAPEGSTAIATQFQQGAAPVARPVTGDAPSDSPSLARTPPAWPAEMSTANVTASPPLQRPQQTIEPAPPADGRQTVATTQAPWLAAQAAPAVTPAAAGVPGGLAAAAPAASIAATAVPSPAPASPFASTAPAAAVPPPAAVAPPAPAAAPAPAAPPAPPRSPATSMQSQFIAALQKPFTNLWKPSSSGKDTATAATTPPAGQQTPAVAAYGAAAGAQAKTADASAPEAHGSMPLGLEGYCPVTVAERGVWTEGRPQWGARHRGRTYLFAGPEQQQAFLADPDRYAPALSGDDPVLALESGKSTPGQRCYGVTYQSRMYLFATPETRTAFSSNPSRYTGRVAIAEQLPGGMAATVRR